MAWNIPLFKIYWDEQDVEKVTSVIKKGMYWAIGPDVREFESRVAEYVGVQYAIAMNSGTSALHVILAAHDIGEGDEVIVPSFTFIATANAPLFVGAKPVFAEIDDETYGLDPQDVERKITPKTKAIIPIHFGGSPCHIEELKQVAKKHNLILIEDAAESLGAMVNNKKVASFGDSAILSFCANKVITTGEGGMILTDSTDICEKVKLICNHGRAETADYFSSTEQMEYVTLGYNFRMSTITAALGIAQMEKIDEIIRMRRENASYLSGWLSKIEEIRTSKVPEGYFHVHQIYTIRVNQEEDTRDRLKEYLTECGIMSRIYFDPVHLTQFYRREFGCREGYLPLTEKVASEVLTLPMYPTLTKEEMDYIGQRIQDFFARGAR
ncbi:DegT/DnrJ/EryC1/StrS family aminotransferase [Dehalococcoidia bacterium]|nr:DegT/DnrJ/EryC1/StrS family aminotransferase [Dehalococcoidia bacterium]